jgi:hypothetical protein
MDTYIYALLNDSAAGCTAIIVVEFTLHYVVEYKKKVHKKQSCSAKFSSASKPPTARFASHPPPFSWLIQWRLR